MSVWVQEVVCAVVVGLAVLYLLARGGALSWLFPRPDVPVQNLLRQSRPRRTSSAAIGRQHP
jgi:hypothetical protein